MMKGNKKWQKLVVGALTGIMCLTCVTACGGLRPDSGEEVDKNRTQVYVKYYNGGLGKSWMPALKEAFEKLHPEIQIMPLPGISDMDAGTILNKFTTEKADLYFMDYVGSEYLKQFRTKGYIADMTKYIKDEKLSEFGEDKTLWDKVTPAVKDYYDVEGKVYALPWYQASYQMIYDVALFQEKKYYVNSAGAWNDGTAKSAGQDGIAGTFDDGLPVTQSDFFALLDKMVDDGVLPLTFLGSQAYYFTSYLTNMFADYEGYNDFMLNYTLEGEDSDFGEVTLEDAYRLKNGQSGKKYALEFTERLITNPDYYSTKTFQTSHTNYAAQDEFLLSCELSKESSKVKPVAMIVDGPWWEREANDTMNVMVDEYKNDAYAYGTREFGIMPMPQADDGSSAEGNTVACTSGCSLIFMNNASQVKDAAGLFLQFCHSDEGLRIATAESGVMRPYNYTMTQEYLDKMTPFGRLTYEYNNSAQIVFEELPVSRFLQDEGAKYCSYLYTWVSTVNTSANVAKYFQPGQEGHSVSEYLKGMAVDPAPWQDAVEEYRFRTEE